MVTFDSPFERCLECGSYVLLDQTQQECAKEHGCENIDCPLKRYFAPPMPAESPPEPRPD